MGSVKQSKPQRYGDMPRVSFGRDRADLTKPYFILIETDEGREYMRLSEDDARHHVRVGWGL